MAGIFAADALSWCEDDPERWSEVITDYLPGIDPQTLDWWDGTGRQRVDFALPGEVIPHDADRVTVEVLVRITPYSRSGATPVTPAKTSRAELPIRGRPSTAPPPAAAGWRGENAYRARLLVPVTRCPDGTLAIDAAAFQEGS